MKTVKGGPRTTILTVRVKPGAPKTISAHAQPATRSAWLRALITWALANNWQPPKGSK